MSLNKILVIGNVGTDPDMRYTPNGSPVTSFRLATNRRYSTANGEQREETEWFTITAWNQLAEQCNQFVTKGMRVFAEGRLKSDSWTGNDGQTRFRNEIVASQIVFLDRKQEEAGATEFESNIPPQPSASSQNMPTGNESDAEDLPW